MTRIIAGIARGRRLKVPAGDRVRPTADRVKEALFASLQAKIPNARVLDLFAGSGALGLEALSRCAASVTVVEADSRVLPVLRENIRTVGLEPVTVVASPAAAFLRTARDVDPFDIVFLDPPYAFPGDELAGVLQDLMSHLAPQAVVIVERSSSSPVPDWPEGLVPHSIRRYGATMLHRATLSERSVDP